MYHKYKLLNQDRPQLLWGNAVKKDNLIKEIKVFHHAKTALIISLSVQWKKDYFVLPMQ